MIPELVPPEPSAMRRTAYVERTKPPGPDTDPEGWFTLEPTKIAGKLFHTEDAEVTATVSQYTVNHDPRSSPSQAIPRETGMITPVF